MHLENRVVFKQSNLFYPLTNQLAEMAKHLYASLFPMSKGNGLPSGIESDVNNNENFLAPKRNKAEMHSCH